MYFYDAAERLSDILNKTLGPNLSDAFKTWESYIVNDNASTIAKSSKFNVKTTPDQLVISIDLPGIRPTDLKVSTIDNWLVVSGKRFDTQVPIKEAITINEFWDLNTINAVFEFGILTVKFNLKQTNKRVEKTIPVSFK